MMGGAMYLLVIGLVAVIIAILVAAFLTLRRRPADDDEPDSRMPVRDRVRGRGRGRDDRWDGAPHRPAGRTTAGGRPVVSRRPGSDAGSYRRPVRSYEAAGYDQDRGYEPAPRGYGERSPVGGYEPEHVPAARRGGRYPEAGAAAGRPARTAATDARGAAATAYDTGPGAALYDTGPGAAADLTATQVHADPDLADSDVFPRVHADIPRPASKAGKQRNQPKSRGKASRKHDDDEDDWPSTEWDKLSDVEYWAELSADKPLATTARTAQPAAPAKPAADTARGARPASGRPAAPPAPVDYPDGTVGGGRPAQRRPSPSARPQSTRPPAGREPGPRRPAGQPASAQRTDPRAGDPAEWLGARGEQPDVTERIPVLDRQRRPATPPPYADDDPLTSPSFSRASAPAEDSRSYQAAGRGQARSSNGSAPAGGYPRMPGSGGYPSSSPAELAGYPAPASGRRDYPAVPTAAGYPDAGDRTDPLGVRTDPAAGRPAASRPPADSRRRAESAPPAAASNPYGSFVDSAPPTRPASPGPAGSAPASTGPHYPPAQPPASAAGYPGYGTAPATAYPDPYGPPSGGYPSAGAGSDGSTGWYTAPTAPAPQSSGEYPYPGTPSGYPGSNGYLAQPSPAEYGGTYGNGPDGGRYTGGHRSHPYRPDEYGGHHPRQG
jgi:hypothetical protein